MIVVTEEIIISATKTSESPRAIPGSHGPMVTAWGQLTDHPRYLCQTMQVNSLTDHQLCVTAPTCDTS